MKRLKNQEVDEIKEILNSFEWQEYCQTGMRRINGGYAKADLTGYDEDKIDIDLPTECDMIYA